MSNIFERTKEDLLNKNYSLERYDFQRPWGGFLVINEDHTEQFIREYFPDHDTATLTLNNKVSPKILIVEPHKRLSWQYHHRRSEVWRVVQGTVGIIRSMTDDEGELSHYTVGEMVTLAQGERHRLVGLDDWGIVAEIWQHTDPNNPSDEEDIIRLQDDFNRR